MRENWFEKRLRSKVSKENHELDFDGVWSDIQANRSDKDRKRPFFWIWGIFGLFFLGFGLAYMLNTNQEEINQSENRTVFEEKESSLIIDGENTIINTQTQTQDSEDQEDLNELTSDIKSSKQNAIAKIADRQSATSALKINSKKNSTNNLEVVTSNQTKEPSIINLKSDQDLDAFGGVESLDRKTLLNSAELNATANLRRGNQDFSPDSKAILNRLDVLIELSKIGLSTLDNGERKLNLKPSWEVLSSPRISSVKKKNMLSFGFTYGLNNDVLSAKIDSGNLLRIIDRRNMVESRLDYFSSNISYRRLISPSIFFNVGLGFEQYTSRFEYEEYTFTSGSRIDTTEIIIYENGDMSFVSGEVPFVTTSINKNINYLKYRSITLPVGLGLSTDLNDLFNIELEAGIIYHLQLFNKGNVLNSVIGTEDFIPLDELYKSSSHFSSYAGFSINRYLNENWKIGFGIRANLDLTNRAMSSSGISHKMSSYSGQFSISRLF